MKTAKEVVASKKAVLFDLFNTLTGPASSWALTPMTADVLGIDREKWREQIMNKSRFRMVGEEKDPFKILEKMVHAIDPKIPDELIQKATENRIKRFEGALINIPENTLYTLKKLREMGKRLALISNADVTEIISWDKSPLAHCFDKVVFSFEVGFVKPEPEIYEYTLKALNVTAKEAVFVGDGGCSELKGAHRVGLTTIMLTGIIKTLWPEDIDKIKVDADYVIEEIDELVR